MLPRRPPSRCTRRSASAPEAPGGRNDLQGRPTILQHGVATVAVVGYAALTRWVFTVAALGAAGGCGGSAAARPVSVPAGIHRIRHVIVIMQENRSFDNYFGTYPGADGIPMRNGRPTVCSPDPISGRCIRPYHDTQQRDSGGPHATVNALADIAGG